MLMFCDGLCSTGEPQGPAFSLYRTSTSELTCLRGQGAGSTLHHVGPHKEAPGLLRRQRERGACGESLYCGFHRKERVSRVSRLRTGQFE